jgi:chitodextrinase
MRWKRLARGTSLPRNDTQISVGPGDVILYQGNQITIYYETNSWNFTRLAVIEGATKKCSITHGFWSE